MTIAAPRGTFRGPPAFITQRVPVRVSARLAIALALLLAAVPLLWPTIPPLVDLPNHMSRYRIGLDFATSPYFRQWFLFHWVPVGNLGVDLLVTALAPLLGLEPATKLVVMAIPVVTVGGMALIAREVHGRVPATAAFAFLFTYNFPFNYGFVNYAMAMALALPAFALWIGLGTAGRRLLRAAMFVPIGLAVWLAHAFGWGTLGILVFGWELATAREGGRGWPAAIPRAALSCLPLAVPLWPMLAWVGSSALNAQMDLGFDVGRKIALLFLALRNANAIVDVGTVALVWIALALCIGRADMRFDRRLLMPAALLLATYVAMPAMLMGSFHSDMRMTPYVIALFALALRPAARSPFARRIGAAAIALLVAHTGYQTMSYVRIDRLWTGQLAALDHVPLGARVYGFAGVNCPTTWQGDRMDHLNRMAIVRRQAFANGTWPPPGQQTLLVRPDIPAAHDPSDNEMFVPKACRAGPTQAIPGALARLPRDRFEYLWLVNTPRTLWPTRSWLAPIWHGERGILYRILTPAEVRDPRRPRTIARLLG